MSDNTNLNLMKKDELIEVIKNQATEIKVKSKELSEVKSDIDLLKQMIMDLKNSSNVVVETKKETPIVEKKEKKHNEDVVKIGSCLIGRHFLCDNTGAEVIELEDIGDVASISTRMLDSVMTARNKALFKEGLVYFLDDIWYDKYSIKRGLVLDENSIDRIYKLPINDMMKELNRITNEGKNERVKYSLYWAFVKNIAEGKPGYNDKSKEIMLGQYFNVDINNSIGQLAYAKEVGYF
jgi:hypothetical protein